MLTTPPSKFRRTRKPVKRKPPTVPTGSLSLVAVQNVVVVSNTITCDLVFDTSVAFPLTNVASASAAKWSVRYSNTLYNASSLVQSAYNVITLHGSSALGPPGGNVVNYTNAPSDIADTAGRQLAAISGMAF
jgi:hypothetical protein